MACLSDLWGGGGGGEGGGLYIEAQCGPLVMGRGSAYALQRFSTCSLSFCAHTVWASTVKSAADLKEDAAQRDVFGKADGLPC